MVLRIWTRFRVNNLAYKIALFCICSYALLEHSSISIPAVSSIKLPLLYMGAVCILSQINLQIRNFKKVKYFYLWLIVTALCMALAMSLYANRNPAMGSPPLRTTIRLMLYLLELYALMIWTKETGRDQVLIRFLYLYTLMLTFATDFLLLSRFVVFKSGRYESYLVGTKFSVVYLHMNLFVLRMLQKRKDGVPARSQKTNVILAAAMIGIAIYVDCITGLLGVIMLLVLLFYRRTAFQRRILQLYSPKVLLTLLICSVVFPFLASTIITNRHISYVIEFVLNRSLTLTGRTNIFEMFGDKTRSLWLWGAGMGNGYVAASLLFGYDNVQNATLQWVFQAGILVTALLYVLMFYVFRQLSKMRDKEKVGPIVILIYVYILMGAVETTFNMNYLFFFFLVFMLSREKSKTQSR